MKIGSSVRRRPFLRGLLSAWIRYWSTACSLSAAQAVAEKVFARRQGCRGQRIPFSRLRADAWWNGPRLFEVTLGIPRNLPEPLAGV